MSKGSNRRPSTVPDSVVEENWKRIFNGGEAAVEAEKLEVYVHPADCPHPRCQISF